MCLLFGGYVPLHHLGDCQFDSMNLKHRNSTQRPLLGLACEGIRLPFMRWSNGLLIASFCFVLLSIILIGWRGINFGIDFRGGLLVEFETATPPDLNELRQKLRNVTDGNILLQEFDSNRTFLLRVQKPRLEDGNVTDPQNMIDSIKNTLEQTTIIVTEYRRVETVGPAVGNELRRAAIIAVALALIGIMGYIWLRFEWQFAVSAVLSLLHDMVTTLGFFSLLQLEFTLPSVAALLAIAGYSINDTVVIFDRIRENMRKYKRLGIFPLLDLSLNQTLSRTLLTSVTTLLAIAALVFFGGSVMYGFSLALGWGVLVGTYSSIGLAAPLLVTFGCKSRAGSYDE